MKQITIALLCTFLTLFGYSQNGGIANENSVIRIDYIGYSSGNFEFRIFNKQSCSASTQYLIAHTNQQVDITISGGGHYVLLVAGLPSESQSVKARARSFCPGQSPDQGWVEKNNQGTILPIRLSSFSVSSINNIKCKVAWTTAEESNVDRFEIQTSLDGKDFKTVGTAFSNNKPSLYEMELSINTSTSIYFRLKTVDIDGKIEYSTIVPFKSKNYVYRAYTRGNTLIVEVANPIRVNYRIINMSGLVVDSGYLVNSTSTIPLKISNGVYILKLSSGETFKFLK